MNYKAVFNVPAKYLGNEINALISKIDDKAVNSITIPVTASIGGTFSSPKVSTDLTSGITNLTTQLVEIQKKRLINQGKDEIKDLLGGVLGGKTNPNDTIITKPKDPVKDVLDGIIGGSPKQNDSTKTSPKNQVKDVLGGILGNKKKVKDTIK
jgi:hypothetical protein